MALALVGFCIAAVITYYFRHNPLSHSPQFILRRFTNWFPLGMTYAFLYMARYNLNVSKNALGTAMTKEDFGLIFGAGTVVYGLSFLLNGPLVDRWGGKRGILIASIGAAVANVAMGVVTYLFLMGRLTSNLTLVFSILYSLNMYFQSFGAVSIIKVKAFWFHVRERGIFAGIFGTLISFGVYFAFDWGQAIADAARISGGDGWLARVFRTLFATADRPVDSTWLVFFIPAGLLIFWMVLDVWLIRDTPGDAGFEDFDTHDASSGEMDRTFTMRELLARVFTSPLMLTFAAIEFTAGVIRNGIMQWYYIFARELPQGSSGFFLENWGLLLCLVGVVGGFAGGICSDSFYQSRRGPPVAIAQAIMVIACGVMAFTLFSHPTVVGISALVMACAVITTHSLMGTAATDFGGRKATASGIVDGFVYLGSGLQSVCLGYLTERNWVYWPLFMMPFAFLGFVLAIKIWKDLPEATKRFLDSRELELVEPK
jgi:OPA family glycerol-3-phosphate transporter-like MFS transporter